MNNRRVLLASVLILAAVLAAACASDAVSTTGTVATTAATATTAPPTAQTTVPDDNTYGARVQAWLDTYAVRLEKAFAEQGDLVDSWKGRSEQLASAKAAADLAHEAFNSLRAIVPPVQWAGAQATYLEALDRVAEDFDELARGDAFSAAYGWPLSQFLVEARQTFTSEVLGLPASVAVSQTTTAPPTTQPTLTGQTPSEEVISALEGRIAAWTGGDLKAAAAFYAVNGIMEEMDQSPPIVTQGRSQIAARLQDLYNMGLRLKPTGAPIQNGRWVAEPVIYYTPNPADEPGAGMLLFEMSPSGEILHQWAY